MGTAGVYQHQAATAQLGQQRAQGGAAVGAETLNTCLVGQGLGLGPGAHALVAVADDGDFRRRLLGSGLARQAQHHRGFARA